jgi:hypothetical protein
MRNILKKKEIYIYIYRIDAIVIHCCKIEMLPERQGPKVTCECAVELEAGREEGQPGKRAGRLGLGSGKAVKGKDRINQPRRTVKGSKQKL